MGGLSSQAMIVHFPPCWTLIYFRLPHEMATSSMVYIRCTSAWLLMLHASSHATSLINTKPGEPGFAWRGKAGGICQTGNPRVKEYITWKLALLPTPNEQVIAHWGTTPGSIKHWAWSTPPQQPPTPHQQIHWRRTHPTITRKCHLDVHFKQHKIFL